MKKIIILILVIVVALSVMFVYSNWKAEKDLQDFANSANPNSTTTKTYTVAEVSVHNTKSNCWLMINGEVIDVTAFVDKHPGGDVILQGCGKDATSMFNAVPEHFKGIVVTLAKRMTIGTVAK